MASSLIPALLLDRKHIILKTALETQQMSNWRVNYRHVPLVSLSTALWHKNPELLSDGAELSFFSGSTNLTD